MISSKEIFQKFEPQKTVNDKMINEKEIKTAEIKPRYFTLVVKRGENHRFEAIHHK